MRVIVAGSRNCPKLDYVRQALDKSPFYMDELVSGGARGVDTFGEMIANEKRIKIRRFPADWNRFGKSAGYRRNEEMATYADALVAVWDGQSVGTKHMIDIARNHHIPVYIFKYNPVDANKVMR